MANTRTLILTHGSLAEELLRAAETIVGALPSFRVLTLDWDDSFEEAERKTREALAELESDEELLILTDMYGGTPYNVAVSLAQPGRVEVVTGVNLPMVVRLGCPGANKRSIGELAQWIQEKARQSICRAGEGNGESAESSAGEEGTSCD